MLNIQKCRCFRLTPSKSVWNNFLSFFFQRDKFRFRQIIKSTFDNYKTFLKKFLFFIFDPPKGDNFLTPIYGPYFSHHYTCIDRVRLKHLLKTSSKTTFHFYISSIQQTVLSHMEPERGFEPGSAGYKATALPFELSSIDFKIKV